MALRRLAVQPVHAHRAPRLDLGRLGLDQRDDVRDHVCVLYMVVGDARQIDHLLAVAAAGAADVGFARLAGAVADAAEDRQRHRGLDMMQRLLAPLHGPYAAEPMPWHAPARPDAATAG